MQSQRAEPSGGLARRPQQGVAVCPQVNQRVAKEELTDLSGDPFFPKVRDACPRCQALLILQSGERSILDISDLWAQCAARQGCRSRPG